MDVSDQVFLVAEMRERTDPQVLDFLRQTVADHARGTQTYDSYIVSYAIEALQEKGRRPGQVKVCTRYDAASGVITLKVSDNGPGMTPEIKEHIFELFFTTKGHRGTGLGLTVVNKFVQDHGGQLRVDSENGKGATVTLELPV